MSTNRADLWGFSANNNMATVAAFPHLYFTLFKDSGGFDILKQCTIALFMGFLDCANHAKLSGKLWEAFLFGSLCKALVHISPLVVFAIGSGGEVCGSIANAVEFFEPHLSMFFFVVCSLIKDSSDLFEAFFLSNGSKVGILVPCTRGREFVP